MMAHFAGDGMGYYVENKRGRESNREIVRAEPTAAADPPPIEVLWS
jgi:hypothetical protein